MKKYFLLSCLLFSIDFLFSFRAAAPTASQLIAEMMEASRRVQTLKFTLLKQERIKGKIAAEKMEVKLQQKPFKVYLKYLQPSAGAEVLFATGLYNNEVLIRPASFPWTTISLDPKGSTMRSGQHHTLHDVGFSQILVITDFILKKYGSEADEILEIAGSRTWNGRNCTEITLSNSNFKFQDHTVAKNENLLTIAARNRVSEYMILEKNPEVDDYWDVKPGQKIKIPSDYAARIVLLLDQRTKLPVVIKVYDDKGLFEHYEYQNLQVNPVFEASEFTRTHPGYRF